MKAPRVFISYSHDDSGHNLSVLEIADQLRKNGVDARLDRYETAPAQGWPRWMQEQVEAADAILVVCTKTYRERFEGKAEEGKGKGADWEGALITQELYSKASQNQKVIPVLLGDSKAEDIPAVLRPYSYFRYPKDFEDLYRLLTDQPKTPSGPLGPLKRLPPKERQGVISSGAFGPPASAKSASENIDADSVEELQSLETIRSAWQSGRLSIVAGAGVSVESGLPTWMHLLGSLLANYVKRLYGGVVAESDQDSILSDLQRELDSFHPIIYAEFIRARFSEEEFSRMVHQALYGNAVHQPKPGGLTTAIARLGHRLNCVLTFNYDNLIEIALRNEGHECFTVCRAADWSKADGIPIYHPHGYLPFEEPDEGWASLPRLVLAESDYHTQYYSPHVWNNVAISRVFLETSCLLVGTSLTDPNLRRLLDAAHREQPDRRHYLLARRPYRDGHSFSNSHSHQALMEVIEASFLQLGVVPVWFDSFDEVPGLLDSVRRLK